MQSFPIQSKTGSCNWSVFLVGAAFFGFLGYKIGAEALQTKPFNIFVGLLGLTCVLGALYSLLAPWLFYRIVIFEDRVELIQFFGLRQQLIDRKDLVSYEIVIRKAKNSTWEVLKLYTADDHYSINSQMYVNFWELRHELTRGLPPV